MINKTTLTNALLISAFVSFFFACTKKEEKIEPVATAPVVTAPVVTTPIVIVTDSVISLDIQVNKIINHKSYQASTDKSLFVKKFDNLQSISLDSIIDKSIKKDVYYYGEFINLSKNRASISDTVFVWERTSENKPLGWNVGFCIGKVCYPPTTVMGEFYLGKQSLTVFDFVFSALDEKQFATNFGTGVLTAEYIIYRKGMKREDAAKFSVKLTAQ